MISLYIHLINILNLIFDEITEVMIRQTCFELNESVCNDSHFSSSQCYVRCCCRNLEKEVPLVQGYYSDLTAFKSTNILRVT